MTSTVRVNYNTLPIYDSLDKQHEFKRYGSRFPIYTWNNKILPFQYVRDTQAPAGVGTIELFDENHNLVKDLTEIMNITVNTATVGGVHVITNKGETFVGYEMPTNKRMYLKIQKTQFGGDNYIYTEKFECLDQDFIDEYALVLEWWNKSNYTTQNGTIYYTGDYRNVMILDSEIGKSQLKYQETVSQRLGYDFPLSQFFYKEYKTVATMIEEQVDAFGFAKISDYFRATYQGLVYDFNSVVFTQEWTKSGDYAIIDMEMKVNVAAKKAIATPLHGDYNDDFNDDFDNL